MTMPPQSDSFTWGYIDCALWSSLDDAGVPLDTNCGATDLAPETLESMKADCAAFKEQYWEFICGDLSGAGHDCWLTRNHHGCGFWDGDWPEAGDRLTEGCEAYPEVTLYVGDDGLIYA